MNTRILEPLGMIDTGYAMTGARKERLAKVYEHGSGGTLRPVPSLGERSPRGKEIFREAGLVCFSTLDDYARFAQMLCNGGELAGERIIGRKTRELMVVPNHLTGLAVPFHNQGCGTRLRSRS